MSFAWWFMAAHHELEQAEVRAPDTTVETVEPAPKPVKKGPLVCPLCGRRGRGIAKHIRHCKG
jgi:hypothetical protein